MRTTHLLIQQLGQQVVSQGDVAWQERRYNDVRISDTELWMMMTVSMMLAMRMTSERDNVGSRQGGGEEGIRTLQEPRETVKKCLRYEPMKMMGGWR